jgi:glycosyltransferase involved in cell wall biosynthesis
MVKKGMKKTLKLSVVLSTINEEKNIGKCLESVKEIADEMIVFDESSRDKTREIARNKGAKVHKVKHEPIFHKTKQKALSLAKGEWILQLDADERVSRKLAQEIKQIVNMTNNEIRKRVFKDKRKERLFNKHQALIEKRDGKIGEATGEVVAFFIPRLNFYLKRPLIHGGVYPDGVIRLVKNGKARFLAKSVHEQIEIDGEVSWLFNDLEHHDPPTFKQVFYKMERYTDLFAKDFKDQNLSKGLLSFIRYVFLKPIVVFVNLYFIHKGILDGWRGFLWALFSSWHYPVAFYKYLRS